MIDEHDDDTAEVDEFLDDYAYMECRGDGHNYPRLKPWQGWEIEGAGPTQVFVRRRRCQICKTTRVERRNNRFRSLSSRYEGYPDGYRAVGLRITRTDVYRLGLQKMLADQVKAARQPRRANTGRSLKRRSS